jgi:hypothetical protein
MAESLVENLNLQDEQFRTIGSPLEFTGFESIHAENLMNVRFNNGLAKTVAPEIVREIECSASRGFRMLVFSPTNKVNTMLAEHVIELSNNGPSKFDHFVVSADSARLSEAIEVLSHPSEDNIIVFCTSCCSTGVNSVGVTHCYVIGGAYSIVELSQMFFRSGRGAGASKGKCYVYFAEQLWNDLLDGESKYIENLKSIGVKYEDVNHVLGMRSLPKMFEQGNNESCVARYLERVLNDGFDLPISDGGCGICNRCQNQTTPIVSAMVPPTKAVLASSQYRQSTLVAASALLPLPDTTTSTRDRLQTPLGPASPIPAVAAVSIQELQAIESSSIPSSLPKAYLAIVPESPSSPVSAPTAVRVRSTELSCPSPVISTIKRTKLSLVPHSDTSLPASTEKRSTELFRTPAAVKDVSSTNSSVSSLVSFSRVDSDLVARDPKKSTNSFSARLSASSPHTVKASSTKSNQVLARGSSSSSSAAPVNEIALKTSAHSSGSKELSSVVNNVKAHPSDPKRLTVQTSSSSSSAALPNVSASNNPSNLNQQSQASSAASYIPKPVPKKMAPLSSAGLIVEKSLQVPGAKVNQKLVPQGAKQVDSLNERSDKRVKSSSLDARGKRLDDIMRIYEEFDKSVIKSVGLANVHCLCCGVSQSKPCFRNNCRYFKEKGLDKGGCGLCGDERHDFKLIKQEMSRIREEHEQRGKLRDTVNYEESIVQTCCILRDSFNPQKVCRCSRKICQDERGSVCKTWQRSFSLMLLACYDDKNKARMIQFIGDLTPEQMRSFQSFFNWAIHGVFAFNGKIYQNMVKVVAFFSCCLKA